MTKKEYFIRQKKAADYLMEKAHIVLKEDEIPSIEIIDYGFEDDPVIGFQLYTYVNTPRYCAKELVLYPHQTCIEHKHPPFEGLCIFIYLGRKARNRRQSSRKGRSPTCQRRQKNWNFTPAICIPFCRIHGIGSRAVMKGASYQNFHPIARMRMISFQTQGLRIHWQQWRTTEMKTYAMTIDLKNDPEILALYEEYHSNVWPEVRQAVKKVGMENVRIFRFGTRLVQIFDARDDFDITKDIDAYAEDPVVRKWDTMMNGFQVPLNGRREGEWWAEMELVYDSNMYPD